MPISITPELIIGVVVAIAALMALFRSDKKVLGMNKWFVGIVLAIVAIVALAQPLGYAIPFIGGGFSTLSVDNGAAAAATNPSSPSSLLTYQPTATYSVKDKNSATTFSAGGTSYYIVNGAAAVTTSQANVNSGDKITYWLDNSTSPYWVQPAVVTAAAGVNRVQATAISNGTSALTLYDLVNRQSVTAGVYNTSMGANKIASIELTYQQTAKSSSAPFGGVLVVEYSNLISSVTCSGDGLLTTNPYHITYSATNTSNTFKAFAFDSTLDDGNNVADTKRITCQFQNGGTGVSAGSPYYFNVIPANYYVSQAGNIELDTEKYADGVNTRTGSKYNSPSVSAFFGG